MYQYGYVADVPLNLVGGSLVFVVSVMLNSIICEFCLRSLYPVKFGIISKPNFKLRLMRRENIMNMIQLGRMGEEYI